MSQAQVQLLIYLVFVTASIQLESAFSHLHDRFSKLRGKKNNFRFSRYFFLISSPLIATLVAFLYLGLPILQAYLLFVVAGLVLEWLAGYSYLLIIGERLWEYKRYSLSGHTSWLAAPLWGFGGVVFYLILRAFTLTQ